MTHNKITIKFIFINTSTHKMNNNYPHMNPFSNNSNTSLKHGQFCQQ